jgi:hypothetical protein
VNDSWTNWPDSRAASGTPSGSTDDAPDGDESSLQNPEARDPPDVSRGKMAWRLQAYAVWARDPVPEALRDEPASVSLVYLIVKHEGPCSASLVLDKGLALGTVYGALDTLEERGLVERCPDPLRSRTEVVWVPDHHEHPHERFALPSLG